MVKVSVIIPVYNCEPYLKQCIRSVFAQTLKEIEVICVDDGSTDGSIEIIKEMAQSDSRILLFQQEHQGPGTARNYAIERANGKYVAFLDADDFYYDSDGLEKMYKACERMDTAICASLYWNASDEILVLDPLLPNTEEETVLNYQDYQMDYGFVNYLFLRKLLFNKKIYFPPYIRYEDPPFLAKALYEAHVFTVVKTCLYYYRIPDINSRFDRKRTVDLLQGLLQNLEFARKYGLEILFKRTVQRLEYEYADIVYTNSSADSLDIIKMLLQINQIIEKDRGKGYIIRPLRLILFNTKIYGENLAEKIREEKQVAIYGAGKFGKTFLGFLKRENLIDQVENILVSESERNETEVDGIPVIELRQFKRGKDTKIFVTVGEPHQAEIEKELIKNDYNHYEIIREEFLSVLSQ